MRRIRIVRQHWNERAEVEDWVAEESLLEIVFPSGRKKRAVLTPEKIREFVYGHLLGEGIIKGPEDVRSYKEALDTENGDIIRVFLELENGPEEFESLVTGIACPQSASDELGLSPWEPRPLFSKEVIFSLPSLLHPYTEEFRLTGAYHYAFLFTPEPKLAFVAKDIGRHNAVDKVIGEAVLTSFPTEETILYTTGRISADIVSKALRARVPLVVSPGAALLGAINLARRYQLGLVGFLRAKRFNMYAGPAWLIP